MIARLPIENKKCSLGIAVMVLPAVALLGAAVQLPPELAVYHGKSQRTTKNNREARKVFFFFAHFADLAVELSVDQNRK